MKYLMLVLKNLLRSKRRTILTVLSIAVSLFIFSALISLPTVANQILADTASSERLAVHNKAGVVYGIPSAYQPKVAAVPHVMAAVRQSWFGGIFHDVKDQFPNFGVDADQADIMWPDWGVTPAEWAAFKKLRTACLVGPATLKRFGFHVGQQIQLKGTVYPFNLQLTIVGELRGKAPPNFLIFQREYLKQAAEAAGMDPFVDTIWARLDKAENATPVIRQIDEQFDNSSAETRTESEAAFFGGFLEQSRTFFRLAEFLGFIVVLTIGLVAANTAAMSIRERRGEIAVLRSIGFTSRTIFGLLLSESVLIGLIGGVLGCVTAYVVLKVFSIGVTIPGLQNIRMPPVVLGETLVLAVLIGVLSAFVPARSAARRNIVDALRAVA
ncbi:MAG TPA: FtsX-like permease family protein [Candidatus Binataceae bacterium]|nr:FtsX-like permease family protein [Candidatus Binataceae bacterium]